MPSILCRAAVTLCSVLFSFACQAEDTFPPLKGNDAPADFESLWGHFDARAEPLETEILHQWEEDDVVLRVVRFRVGIFKGKPARLAAVYGFPKSAEDSETKVPGLLQIHGGGQYADYKACLTNAKRGYATVSIAWAGRISAPGYRVTPREVQLFWEQKADDSDYRVTTDWGAVDGYHAPSRNAGNQFPSAKPAKWTLDAVESPRNSGWFLCAVAARRALTFLERQPEVDADRLGVYGHSMGGKLTVLTAVDERVKAAAPSCGGISDRYNSSEIFRTTLGDDVSLKRVRCPIIFLSPANDFHGRIGNLPSAVKEIQTDQWRVTCSPHHNHQDTAEYEVATQLWFDQHLKSAFEFPKTPRAKLQLKTDSGTPYLEVVPDTSRSIRSVDVFYTQGGKPDEDQSDIEQVKTRFWHHASAANMGRSWMAEVPVHSTDRPVWVYVNVLYELPEPVTGAGYYYRTYTADTFNVSSLLTMVDSDQLADADVLGTLQPTQIVEDFEGSWRKEWFSYRPEEWSITTNKLADPMYAAPADAKLELTVRSQQPNTLVIVSGGYGTEISLEGGSDWQTVSLALSDIQNLAAETPEQWSELRQLKLTDAEHLRPPRGSSLQRRRLGKNWQGPPPEFKLLRWVAP